MSATAEETLGEIALKDASKLRFKDEETTSLLRNMYLKCFMNTIQNTVTYNKYDVYLTVGGIPAMWLRDSSLQVLPYLKYAFAQESVRDFLCKLMIRQFYCIVQDPYANAFKENPNKPTDWSLDITEMAPIVWERKFQLDSLCFPVWLLNKYVESTADYSILEEKNVKNGLISILNVFETELDHANKSDYSFHRIGGKPEDTLERDGKGPAYKNTGMIWSAFRSCSNACEYSFNIPANHFASYILDIIRRLFSDYYEDSKGAMKATTIKASVDKGLSKHGIVTDRYCGAIFAYETDGMGNYAVCDDACLPGLLSLPFLGVMSRDNVTYQATRQFILCPRNPYYFKGKLAKGLGSSSTPKGYIWPMGLIMEALTETSKNRREEILYSLVHCTGGKGFIHESFDSNDDNNYTREQLAVANALFAYLVRDMLL